MEHFRQAGYTSVAAGQPGEPDTVAHGRLHPESVDNFGIIDATGHFADIIDGLEAPPGIMGHWFGGLITEKFLGQGVGTAASPSIPAQIKGVLPLARLRAGLPALGPQPPCTRRSH